MQADGSPGECTGKGAVLRVSFGNFIFFAAHFLLLLGCRKQKDARKYLHTGCLTLQTLVWAGIIGSTFAMPNHVFFVWGQVCALIKPEIIYAVMTELYFESTEYSTW